MEEYKLPPLFADRVEPDTTNLAIHVGVLSEAEQLEVNRGCDFGSNTLYVPEFSALRNYDWSLVNDKCITLFINDDAYRASNKRITDNALYDLFFNRCAIAMAIIDTQYPAMFAYRKREWLDQEAA